MSEAPSPSVGEQVKAAQMGQSDGYLTFEKIDQAPSDLVEDDVDVPEWGGKVRVRSLTAAQATAIQQKGLAFKGDETKVAWEEMEVMQVAFGLVNPNLSAEQVRVLRLKRSAKGFARIVAWLDEKSGINKEELRKAQQEFQDES